MTNQNNNMVQIDMRCFLLMITTLMLLGFGIGVSHGFGDSGDRWILSLIMGNGNVSEANDIAIIKDPTVVRSFQQNKTDGVWVVDEDETRAKSNEQDRDISYKKRHPTKHVADLGELVDPEPDEEEHQPSGQHLLVDLKNVEYDFLDNEDRLVGAMIDVVRESKLTLLSYHCHSLQPAGVSCVGVLLESHVSFHTWPDEGVITFDLFTCGANALIPVIPIVEQVFGVPRSDDEEVESRWSHELRGFRNNKDRMQHHLDNASDLAVWITAPIKLYNKKEIVSVQSPIQRIDIWDAQNPFDTPGYEDILKHGLQEGDPRLLTAELVSPQRYFFLDGTLQVSYYLSRHTH